MTSKAENIQNPLLRKYETPHGTIPFDKINVSDFEPAIERCIALHDEEIKKIKENKDVPTFKNTIEALERSGELLDEVTSIFGNLLGTKASDELHAVAAKMVPLLSEHSNNIGLSESLFERVKAVYDQKGDLQLNLEQTKLLEDTYNDFVRSGANLKGKEKEEYRHLTNELSQLTLAYEQNCLKNNNSYQLLLNDIRQMSGLPDNILEAAAEAAKEKNLVGYVFTLQAPSYLAFMRYADNRELRQQMYMAYNTQGVKDNGYCNLEIVRSIVNDRLAIAQLLGYPDYASFVLEKRMAQDKQHVYNLLNELLKAYSDAAHSDCHEIEAFAKEIEGADFELQPWDWLYYSNKLKEKKYHIETELLRPYFELGKVKKGIFDLANKLYGLTFKRNTHIPVYHHDVETYEVFDENGSYLAILYLDFFPREGKQAGGWTSSFKEQWKDTFTHEDHRPQILISTNFTKPTQSRPSLLTFEEVRTFLHEFGHSLHAMLSNVTYKSLSGTNVYWDFVELPSQFLENYAIEKDFLHTFAFHYETGELIPDEYVQRIIDADNFNIAYSCLRQLSFGFLDMAWYTRQEPFNGDVIVYEKNAQQETQLLPVVEGTCMSTQFSHIFNGGYAAGYYSYKWAEVLEADAFSLFKENGIYDKATAHSFRENILSKGGTELPMVLYKRFRGQEPTIKALLKRDGITK